MTPSPDEFPESLSSRYKDAVFIGEGATGRVFRVHDTVLNKVVAIKILLDSASNFQLVRLQKEAKALAMLQHPNIVMVLDFNLTVEDQPYLVMEYIDGSDLAGLIRQSGAVIPFNVVSILREVCFGMDYAHQAGILHRDLKPSNILLVEAQADEGTVKIVDFGLAKNFGGDIDTTSHSLVKGTPAYMSPEHGNGAELDRRSDIYSFGCVFFELLTGSQPFQASSPLEMVLQHNSAPVPDMKKLYGHLNIPDSLIAVVNKCMAKAADERYQTFAQIVAQLDQIVEDLESDKASAEEAHGEFVGGDLKLLSGRDDRNPNDLVAKIGISAVVVISILAFSYAGFLALNDGKESETSQTPQLKPLENSVERILSKQKQSGLDSIKHLSAAKLPKALDSLDNKALYRAAKSLMKQDKYATALSCFTEVLKRDPQKAEAYIYRSDCYKAYDDYESAVKDLTRALLLEPENERALDRRFEILAKQGKPDQALVDCTILIKLHPDEAKHYARRARIKAIQDDVDSAIANISKAIELDPEYASYYRDRANYYSRLKKFDRVVSDLTTGINLESCNSNMFFNRGLAYASLKQYDKAVSDYTKAIKLKPDRSDYYAKRAIAYDALNKHDLAIIDRKSAKIDNFNLQF